MKQINFRMSYEEQQELFLHCINKKVDLEKELKRLELNYEDLRYSSYPKLEILGADYERLEDKEVSSNHIPTVSFFAGAGGFDIGFEYAGFEALAAIEINEIFCNTLKLNFPDKLVFNIDVRKREELYILLKEEAGISEPFEGVFHGGPPCQPFSIAANQRFSKEGENFKRIGFEHAEYGNLLADYIWFIKQFRPKVFIIENVAGLFEIDNGEQLSKELAVLAECGYKISSPKIINVADYGVPQNRTRLFVIGSRTDESFIFPKKNKQKVPCFHVFEKSLDGIPNHETRTHKAESVARYMQLIYGQRDKLGRVDRLDPRLPSKTVIAGGVKGGGRSHLHPYIPRTLSARESARLQTFPDNYVFTGPIARQFTQIGNAVPPLFAYKLANEIFKQFYGHLSPSTLVTKLRNISTI